MDDQVTYSSSGLGLSESDRVYVGLHSDGAMGSLAPPILPTWILVAVEETDPDPTD